MGRDADVVYQANLAGESARSPGVSKTIGGEYLLPLFYTPFIILCNHYSYIER